MAEISERVQKGAELLDEKVPGWADRIDITRLTISSSTDCVVGQLYAGRGGYLHGLDELGIGFGTYNVDKDDEDYKDQDQDQDVAHGFDYNRFGDRELLNAEWRTAVANRREKANG